jgi:hypothetical protein
MFEQETNIPRFRFRKLEQVTHTHLVHWQCPTCGCEIEQPVLPNTITPLTCPARGCQQGFQLKGDEVFVAEPL